MSKPGKEYWASHYETYDEDTEWAEWLCDYAGLSLERAREVAGIYCAEGYEVMVQKWDGDDFTAVDLEDE